MFNKKLIPALAVALLLFSMVAVGPALAAKSSTSGHGGHGGTTSAGKLTVSPNPAPFGITQITINGSGFGANQTLGVGVYSYTPMYWITSDASGAFSFAYHVFDNRQIYSSTAYVTDGAGNLLTTAPFTVCSTNPC
jgi:hypothetical protein